MSSPNFRFLATEHVTSKVNINCTAEKYFLPNKARHDSVRADHMPLQEWGNKLEKDKGKEEEDGSSVNEFEDNEDASESG